MVPYAEDNTLTIDCFDPSGEDSDGISGGTGIDDVTNGLIATTDDFAHIHTGIARGHVAVEAAVFDAPPPLVTDGWDEVVDVPFTSTDGKAFLSANDESLPLNLASYGPGTYRLRLHAKGRDTGRHTGPGHRPQGHHPAGWDPGQDPGPWDDVVVTDFKSTTGEAYLDTCLNGPAADEENYTHKGPGKYRVRVHARHRSAHPDGVQNNDADPFESYLIQIWPARGRPKR
ncbi:hypothetical protein ACQB60_10345 [Actinomycetota bacterium Odt1-20B]